MLSKLSTMWQAMAMQPNNDSALRFDAEVHFAASTLLAKTQITSCGRKVRGGGP
jgi:hypothetical protein